MHIYVHIYIVHSIREHAIHICTYIRTNTQTRPVVNVVVATAVAVDT